MFPHHHHSTLVLLTGTNVTPGVTLVADLTNSFANDTLCISIFLLSFSCHTISVFCSPMYSPRWRKARDMINRWPLVAKVAVHRRGVFPFHMNTPGTETKGELCGCAEVGNRVHQRRCQYMKSWMPGACTHTGKCTQKPIFL